MAEPAPGPGYDEIAGALIVGGLGVTRGIESITDALNSLNRPGAAAGYAVPGPVPGYGPVPGSGPVPPPGAGQVPPPGPGPVPPPGPAPQ